MVEFDLGYQYKSLDDVSLKSNNNQWNNECSQPTNSEWTVSQSHHNDHFNCDEKKSNHSKVLQRCDKTPFRAKNVLIRKKDLQCERCGYVQAICDEKNIENQWSNRTACHLDAKNLNNNFFKDRIALKSTNFKNISGSTNSLRKSTMAVVDVNSIVRRRIVYAQVLLEAFGNASNPLNSNSSRFVSTTNSFSIEIFLIHFFSSFFKLTG